MCHISYSLKTGENGIRNQNKMPQDDDNDGNNLLCFRKNEKLSRARRRERLNAACELPIYQPVPLHVYFPDHSQN